MKYNNQIAYNQLRLKLLHKHVFTKFYPKKINLSINLYKIKSISDSYIVESLFLLEFISSLKSIIRNYKKSYQSWNIDLSTTIRKKYMYYYMGILKIFYSSISQKRSGSLRFSFDSSNNLLFCLPEVKDLPFLPEIYFRYKNLVSTSFYLTAKSKKESLLILNYLTNLR